MELFLSRNLKVLRKKKGDTQAVVARALGVGTTAITNYEKGTSTPEFHTLIKLSEYYKIKLDELVFGKRSYGEHVELSIGRVSDTKEKYRTPLINLDAVAGMGNTKFRIQEKDIQEYYVVPDFNDISFMIRVKGSSMYPKYNSGDVIACRIIKESKFIQWGKVYVISTREQGILVKRLKKADRKDFLLAISDNVSYDPFEVPMNEVDGIALVVGVIRLE